MHTQTQAHMWKVSPGYPTGLWGGISLDPPGQEVVWWITSLVISRLLFFGLITAVGYDNTRAAHRLPRIASH